MIFFFFFLKSTKGQWYISLPDPDRPHVENCNRNYSHRSGNKATLEGPYPCYFFHKPSWFRSAGLQTGSARSAWGTAQGSPLGYGGSIGIVPRCPRCRRPGRWKNKSSTSRHDKWVSFEMTECLVFMQFDLTVHFGAKHCVCATTLSFSCLKCHLNFAASYCLLQNDKCTSLFVFSPFEERLTVLRVCWNAEIVFFLFYFILLYVSLFFYSISPDRHKHHKGMSQHKKRREKNCWHMTLVFIAMTKRCRKWKLQNSGNIRLDLKTEKILSLGKKNNPKTIKQKNVFTELWQQTEIRPILCYTQWGSEGLLDLKMKQWSLQQ